MAGVTSPEALGGVDQSYVKWVRYGMIFGGLYWWTEVQVLLHGEISCPVQDIGATSAKEKLQAIVTELRVICGTTV